MPNWTPQQQQAISARNRTILVSAAAGSGKTAVLVERIVQLIREGWRMDRMLIVTFTKAAAAEMRQRLNKRLVREAQSDPEIMGRALDDLESTEISTIHAFCQKVLRKNFQAVGIDPMVRPCEDQQRKALFDEAWLEALNQLLEENAHHGLIELANAWDQNALYDMTAEVYEFLMSLPAPFDWLDRAVEAVLYKPYERHPWYVTLKNHTRLQIEGISHILQAMRTMLDEPDAVEARREVWQADADAYMALLDVNWNRTDEVINALSGYEMVKAKAARNTSDAQKDWLKRFGKHRDAIKDIISDALEALNIDEERLDREFSMMHLHLTGLAELTKRTHRLFLEKKAQQHVIDFSDMEQFTMEVLSQEELRRQLQAEYDHIFVDECQDVSQVQDAILHAIHSDENHMFMVGDVKQSIYRFRKADPTLFLHRMRTYKDDENAVTRRIFLQKNFRSRYNVLEATNQVFRKAMRPAVTELEYEMEDELICGRETENDPPVEMHLLDLSPDEEGEKVEALEAEAAVVVQRIRELLNESFDDGGEMRNYTYRDMVILLSAASNTAPKLVEMLNSQGIPVFYDGAAAYFSLPEIQTMKALLSVLDNPMQDIPLLSTLKMAPFSFNEEELAQVRLCKTGRNVPFYEAFRACCEGETPLAEKCRQAEKQLQDWRFEAEIMRLSDFIWHILTDSGYYAACGALPEGELRQANLRMLYQRALNFEQDGGATLRDFIRLTDQQSSGDDKTSAKMLGEGENLVRIMTMHKSKGLEFPVVFCMQMSGRLHKGHRGNVLLHTQLGVAMPYVNRELRVKRKTMADEAFRVQRELDEKAERARLLYVAMTRARERLIMVGSCREKDRAIWTLPESDYRVWKAGSMTDWIMQGVYEQDAFNLSTIPQGAGTPWKIRYWDDCDGLAVDKTVDKVCIQEWLQAELNTPADGLFDGWEHMEKTDAAAPLKTSVSAVAKRQVIPDPMPLSESEEDAETKRVPEEIVSPLRLSELPARPTFMEEKQLTGADRGTLVHRALSLIPLQTLRGAESLPRAVHQAVHELVERGVFSGEELMALNLRGVVGFYESELGQRLLRSDLVRREWSFNLLMDDAGGTLLQGVIDCVFMETDGWVLVDYKTDRISDEEAFCQRYAMQLEWYARALERITGQPVKEMWLYAIGKGKAYAMPRIPE